MSFCCCPDRGSARRPFPAQITIKGTFGVGTLHHTMP